MKYPLILLIALSMVPLGVHAADGPKQNGENQAKQAAGGSVHKAELLPADKLVNDAAAISKAQEGMAKSIALAKADPNRPIYHLMPEAHWMNDPNGAFYADGWYHVFYQFNPYGPNWGNIHWGHARSRDNVIWERLPVANWPSTEKGEDHCYSGSAVKDGNGNWQLWYPSVSKVREKDKDKGKLDFVFNGQVMHKPMDKDFIQWGKTTDDPVNKPTLPNNIDGYGWNRYIRDPAFFTASGRTFMVLGISGGGAPLYEGMNKELTEWKYRGVMSESAWDCPQMIPFGNKWLYVINHGQYFLGSFNPDTAKFTSESGGKLDQGDKFANISFSTDDQGRHIVYAWLVGTKGKGWNNCFPLPRVLTLGEDGQPMQNPVPALSQLRGAQESAKVSAGAQLLKTKGDALEINAVFRQADKGKSGLHVRRSEDGTRSLAINYEGGTLDVFGTKFPVAPEGADKAISVQVFLDKAIMEVFVNGGKKTVLKVLYPPLEDQGIEVFTDGEATADVWPMKSIW